MALETPSRPSPPLHGKYHLKFPFWLFDTLPNLQGLFWIIFCRSGLFFCKCLEWLFWIIFAKVDNSYSSSIFYKMLLKIFFKFCSLSFQWSLWIVVPDLFCCPGSLPSMSRAEVVRIVSFQKLDQVHLACRTQFGDLQSIFLWMKRRSTKDKVFRLSKL